MPRSALVGVTLATVLIGVLYYFFTVTPPVSRLSPARLPPLSHLSPEPEFEPPLPRLATDSPSIGIIIDDFGASRLFLDRWFALPNEIAVAVIPHLPSSRQVAREAYDRGFDVFLHQPMEPHGFPDENPGTYAVYIWQSDEEIAELIQNNIASLSVPVTGVNNHMGSRATEDRRAMAAFFDAFPRNLLFLDSRTTQNSVAYDIARAKGVRAMQNNVFLDAVPDSPAAALKSFNLLLHIAKRRGFAVGLGHAYYAATLECLEAHLPHMADSGMHLTRLNPRLFGPG
ncbi:divergent polysaccharide deacetylase family protein [bacterium]|nr:divergent polysaccharide deacetylase family protein [bacterium]